MHSIILELNIIISYVDNQLRHSRRFDAAGIEQDHPELFIPFPRRRSSSSNSLSSLSSASTSARPDEFYVRDEGQLRYWTSDMCSRSPHLFDFVVTVSRGYHTHYVLFTDFRPSARRRWHSSLHFMALPTHRSASAPIRPWLPRLLDQFRFR